MQRIRLVTILAAGLLLGGLCGGGLVRAASGREHTKPLPAPSPALVVPLARGPILIDGEIEDEGWSGTVARTGAFRSAEGGGRPYSDARFTYRGGNLYVVLYAADEDIRATGQKHDDPLYLADVFELVFTTTYGDRIIEVSPRGLVTDGARAASGAAVDFAWESHARVAVDTDGTIDDPSDMDEEWVVEMAVPLDALGLRGPGDQVGLSIRRCDDVKGMGRVCGAWGSEPGATGSLVLGGR